MLNVQFVLLRLVLSQQVCPIPLDIDKVVLVTAVRLQ